ncbi:MAG: excinuclease ABC subunit UvrC [Clostridiales bacterium]|nr:excinuclease ABC subunit UvrC [Clostridiales bacterium]
MNGNSFDARLDTVPTKPGVYLMKDASGNVIYVGKAKVLKNRLRSYFGGGTVTNPKVAAMVSHVADFEYVVVGTEPEALLLENNLIKRYMPQYNILLRDDKGYPYVCITLNEEYPRVFKAFRPDPELRKKGAVYYGPYMSSDLYFTLKSIEEIFPLKRCRKVLPRDIGKERPCLNAHIGRCMAPCSGSVKSSDYRKMIGQIVLFFEGKYGGIEKDLKEEMEKASENMEFERAAVLRDRLSALNNIRQSQRVFMEIKRDVDAIGVYSDAGETCVRKLELRDGRIVGSSVYFMKGANDSVSDVLTGFIMQYYEDAPYIPQTILIPDPGEDGDEFGISDALETLEGFLEQKAGRKVTLKTPERGEMKELQKLAQMNAREMMVRRILRGGGADADPKAPLRYLEEMFKVPEGTIDRVESYDISNLGNDDICAGMVVFKGGRPDKSSYRLFKMKTVMSQDDFASMREVLSRRFSHDGSDGFSYPSLILVDGGKGQLSAVASVVDELAPGKGILLAGMVKNSKHRTSGIVFRDGELIKLDGDNPSDRDVVLLRFLTAVQNEVHRFAISYQHKLAGKRNIRYRLENIHGIGPAKRKALLSHFGSIKKIEEATVEEIGKVKGISEADALNIYDHFHQQEE